MCSVQADLKELTAQRKNSDRGRAYFSKILSHCSAVMLDIINCPKPVIAEVDGWLQRQGVN